ncbi:hypothetical protein K2173_015383 [Erythroxylum novogranatense]|uniref:Uncharacterized protein n=1 Tax=Erythroxylum novogranatense TaxID=1862640 RepID=A0AAV8SRI5_9ROSI|nr:hypothetical protein K2173_015383 [Erythroxylum novogranatense]
MVVKIPLRNEAKPPEMDHSSTGTSRPKYLYLIINLLIFALGAEAGLLSTFSKPSEDKKQAVPVINKAVASSPAESNSSTQTKVITACNEKKAKVVEKSPSEKFNANTEKVEKVRKCPSMPSLFFIGGGETEAEDQVSLHEEHIQEELEEEVGGLSGQELFTKAETFIGNFYKQLKMQREESWKRIHGFYQKAF